MNTPTTAQVFVKIGFEDPILRPITMPIDLTRPMSQGFDGRKTAVLEGSYQQVTTHAGRPTWSYCSYMKSISSYEDRPCTITVIGIEALTQNQHTLLEKQDCLVTLQDRDHYTIKFVDFDAPQMMSLIADWLGVKPIPFTAPKPSAPPEPQPPAPTPA